MFNKVCEVIANTLSCEMEDLKPETRLSEELNADSLDAVELNIALEEEFGISISDEKLATFKTVGDIVAYVEENQ